MHERYVETPESSSLGLKTDDEPLSPYTHRADTPGHGDSASNPSSNTPSFFAQVVDDAIKPLTITSSLPRSLGLERGGLALRKEDGILYVDNEDGWKIMDNMLEDCHLLVWSPSVHVPFMNPSQPLWTEDSLGYKPPTHLLIKNDLLLNNLTTLYTSECHLRVQTAPFRSLVLFEKRLRSTLEEREKTFEIMAKGNPEHHAVLRDESWLPLAFASGDSRGLKTAPGRKEHHFDEIERERILLDGYRALIRCLDTDLRPFCDTVKRMERGRVAENVPKIPPTHLWGLVAEDVPKILFSHLWYLFKPGREIIRMHPKPQVYRVLYAVGGHPGPMPRADELGTEETSRPRPEAAELLVACFYLDYDGNHIGPKDSTFRIEPYDGSLPVTGLPVYPLIFASKEQEVKLVERGRKFAGLTEPSHRRYKGLSIMDGNAFDTYEEVDSHVMVDFTLAFQDSKHIRPPKLGGGVITSPIKEDDGGVKDGQVPFEWSRRNFLNNADVLGFRKPGSLGSRDSFILLPARAYCFVLHSRKWLPLDVELLEEIPVVKPGDLDSFEKLVLPKKHKEVVRALVNTHARQVEGGSTITSGGHKPDLDLVKGKGHGLVILLHGAPGVGKTSTAECVAAQARRPLLPITCGDLGGANPSEVEQSLEKFFYLARKWGCVLLLDEADLFVTSRNKIGNVQQIMLASVFLRVLEYYSGILILTTNRVGAFDEAIKSRVHCALYYPPLSRKQSRAIWKMHLDDLKKRSSGPNPQLRLRIRRKKIMSFMEDHWDDTPEPNRWNGRQIKDAFQTAIALADWDRSTKKAKKDGEGAKKAPRLKDTHFQTVANASAHFDQYLTHVRGSKLGADKPRREAESLASRKASKAGRSKAKRAARTPSPRVVSESEEEESEISDDDDEDSEEDGTDSDDDEDDDDEDDEEDDDDDQDEEDEEDETPEAPPPKPEKKKKNVSGKKR